MFLRVEIVTTAYEGCIFTSETIIQIIHRSTVHNIIEWKELQMKNWYITNIYIMEY